MRAADFSLWLKRWVLYVVLEAAEQAADFFVMVQVADYGARAPVLFFVVAKPASQEADFSVAEQAADCFWWWCNQRVIYFVVEQQWHKWRRKQWRMHRRKLFIGGPSGGRILFCGD